jgi:hypothetical protein
MLRGEIDSTDQATDSLAYQLYGLTEEPPKNGGREIKIVEGGA